MKCLVPVVGVWVALGAVFAACSGDKFSGNEDSPSAGAGDSGGRATGGAASGGAGSSAAGGGSSTGGDGEAGGSSGSDDAGGSSGTSGSNGTSGSDGSGGSGGTAGSAGSPSGGVGGKGGSGGATGTGGSGSSGGAGGAGGTGGSSGGTAGVPTGHAVELAGAEGSYVDAGDIDIPSDFTLELWFKVAPTQPAGNEHIILTKDGDGISANQFRIGLRDGYLHFTMTGASAQNGGLSYTTSGYPLRTSLPVAVDAWRHAAVTKLGNAFALYLDGSLQTTLTATVALTHAGSRPLRVGGRGDPEPLWFRGAVDEVRLWNVARSSAEIGADRLHSIATSHPDYASLVAYWLLNEGTGTLANDARGRWNGTLSSANWITPGAPLTE